MKQERGSKVQVVVQMVRMERNWDEVDDFVRFWQAVPGVDQVRIKADETNLMLGSESGHAPGIGSIPAITYGGVPCTSSTTAMLIHAARAICSTDLLWAISGGNPC